jgi:hypothetical protein
MADNTSLLDPIPGAEHRESGGVKIDVVRTGKCRVKRLIYPVGFAWATHMKPLVDTNLCMHAHAGFLAQGHLGVRYPDGCTRDFKAPYIFAIEPGHEGWVVGDEPAVVIEVDFEKDTAQHLGIPAAHRHD